MALFQKIGSFLLDSDNWLALLLGVSVLYFVHFIQRIRSLPPGPVPLPLLGNVLQLRTPHLLYERAIEWSAQYGDPITIWLGSWPIVIASSKKSFEDLAKTHRNNLAGRMETNFGTLVTRGRQGITFNDFSPAWDILKRVSYVAINKFAQTEKLANLVVEKVDAKLDELFAKQRKVDVDLLEFVEDFLFKVIAESAFGGFEEGDPRYELFRELNNIFETEGANGLPSDIMPILRWIFYRTENRIRDALVRSTDIIEARFEEVAATFTPGQTRHFSDALLNARDQIIAENRSSAKYLDVANLGLVIVELYEAGVGTSRAVLTRCILCLADDLQLQEELREEVLEAIGSSEVCFGSDRDRMPKVDSFINEVLRFYPPAPLSLPRKALVDAVVNGRLVPKNASMLINLYAVNRDTEIWGPDANEFNAKRFLTVSREQLARGFTTFGIGARSCPGLKLAQADLFYSIVRLLQKARLGPATGTDRVQLEAKRSHIVLESQRQSISVESLAGSATLANGVAGS